MKTIKKNLLQERNILFEKNVSKFRISIRSKSLIFEYFISTNVNLCSVISCITDLNTLIFGKCILIINSSFYFAVPFLTSVLRCSSHREGPLHFWKIPFKCHPRIFKCPPPFQLELNVNSHPQQTTLTSNCSFQEFF